MRATDWRASRSEPVLTTVAWTAHQLAANFGGTDKGIDKGFDKGSDGRNNAAPVLVNNSLSGHGFDEPAR